MGDYPLEQAELDPPGMVQGVPQKLAHPIGAGVQEPQDDKGKYGVLPMPSWFN
jgi:hypothetical protein